MGFRTGNYCKVWQVEPKTNLVTSLRISTSKKDKTSGEYVQDFSGFVSFVGKDAAKKAAQLSPGDRIKLGEIEVTSTYVKEKNKEYINYACFSFEPADGIAEAPKGSAEIPNEYIETSDSDEEGLPF